ncbi:hypothetical protein [Agrobacterium rubi]|uniref:hypothetical protein n=1 Tax=Agrobacterium rubi TaxID=28099 RepID=UPI00307F0018
MLRFSAFNQRTTPEIVGQIKTVGADLVHNLQTGESWYTARIQIEPEEMSKLGSLNLLAGMPWRRSSRRRKERRYRIWSNHSLIISKRQ